MGYAQGDAIYTLLKVILTNIGKAIRAYLRSKRTSGKEAEWAINTMKMCLKTIMKAIESILSKL